MTGLTLTYIIIYLCGGVCGFFFGLLFMETKAQGQLEQCLTELAHAQMNDHRDEKGRFVSHKG